MKKLIMILGFTLASIQVMAFEIPIQNCQAKSSTGQLQMTSTKLINSWAVIRNKLTSYVSTAPLKIECTSVVLKDWGRELEVDVKFTNKNSNEPISCYVKAYVAGNRKELATSQVSSGERGTISLVTTANPDELSEVIRVFCSIPQADYIGEGRVPDGWGSDNGSYISSIRVF